MAKNILFPILTIYYCLFSFQVNAADVQRIQALKNQIRDIAERATAQIKYQNDFDKRTRLELDPLVTELVALAPALSVKQQLEASVGAWKNLWSDLPFTRAVASQIYQVVFPTGYYYNVSKYEEKGVVTTSFLRGEYQLRQTDLEIRFTKALRVAGFPAAGADIYRWAMLAELGVFDGQTDGANSAGLNRPGTLKTLFVDEELRIVGGELKQNNVPDSLFVLKRQATIE